MPSFSLFLCFFIESKKKTLFVPNLFFFQKVRLKRLQKLCICPRQGRQLVCSSLQKLCGSRTTRLWPTILPWLMQTKSSTRTDRLPVEEEEEEAEEAAEMAAAQSCKMMNEIAFLGITVCAVIFLAMYDCLSAVLQVSEWYSSDEPKLSICICIRSILLLYTSLRVFFWFIQMAELFREIYPIAFHTKYLQQSLRPDGRQIEETRPVSVSTGVLQSVLGSSFVKLGRTTVMVGVKGELVRFFFSPFFLSFF